MAPVSKSLRDERAAQLKTMTPARRKSQVIAWGKEFDQGRTPAGPSANYKPTPLKPAGSSGRKPFDSLKSKGRSSVVPGTSQGGFSGRKDPRMQAIENLIRNRDTPKPAPWTPPVPVTAPTSMPVDDWPNINAGAGAWPTMGNSGAYGIPGFMSSPTNPTGVGFANVAPGEMTGFEKYLARKNGTG